MIREATTTDTQPIVDLLTIYQAESDMSMEFNREKLVAQIYCSIINCESDVRVVWKDGKLVGVSLTHKESPIYSDDVVAECVVLYVHPEYRKGSVGVSLIKHLKKLAKAWEAKQVRLGVSSGIQTERTEQLYQRLGYTEVGKDFCLNIG